MTNKNKSKIISALDELTADLHKIAAKETDPMVRAIIRAEAIGVERSKTYIDLWLSD